MPIHPPKPAPRVTYHVDLEVPYLRIILILVPCELFPQTQSSTLDTPPIHDRVFGPDVFSIPNHRMETRWC